MTKETDSNHLGEETDSKNPAKRKKFKKQTGEKNNKDKNAKRIKKQKKTKSKKGFHRRGSLFNQ